MYIIRNERRGFTLIELLIVVAIIAILAAIAVPNFIEAQVRAKVSRSKADMRSLATAIESYAVDYNNYPNRDPAGLPLPFRLSTDYSRACLEMLSTPISYITTGKLDDPFATSNPATRYFGYANTRVVQYDTAGAGALPDLVTAFMGTGGNTVGAPVPGTPAGDEAFARFRAKGYLLQSVGPDETNYAQSLATAPTNQGFARAYYFLADPDAGIGWNLLYDPTNGTTSVGDVVRTSGGVLN